jgi:hypothetical protein
MLRLQRPSLLEGIAMRRRLMQALENEKTFTIGVICLGVFSVAMVLVALFLLK